LSVGFHVLHGDVLLATTLADVVRFPEPAVMGGVVGAVGAAVGGGVGHSVRFVAARR
jgi:hypothetical protein